MTNDKLTNRMKYKISNSIAIKKHNSSLQAYLPYKEYFKVNGLLLNSEPYFTVYIDKNFNKHFLISKNKPRKSKYIILSYQQKIYRNSPKSNQLQFTFKVAVREIFELEVGKEIYLGLSSVDKGPFILEIYFKEP